MIDEFNPYVSEEYVHIDDNFNAHYGVFKNNFQHLYPTNFWKGFKGWKSHPFIPTEIALVDGSSKSGVEFECYEHASVCISGSADFILEKTNNASGEYTFNWGFGVSNVDNGFGYLPKGYIKNTNYNNFVTCCVVQADGGKNENAPKMNFEILNLNNSSIVTNKNYKWIHVTYGSLELNNITYNQKETIYDVSINSQLNAINSFIGIAGYLN